MAGELGYHYEELQGSVDRLLAMHDEVTQLRSRVSARAGDAAPGSWPDVPSVQAFARRYHSAVSAAESRLTGVEQALESARVALAESIRAMQNVDAAQRETLDRFVAQLDVVAHVPPAPVPSTAQGSIS